MAKKCPRCSGPVHYAVAHCPNCAHHVGVRHLVAEPGGASLQLAPGNRAWSLLGALFLVVAGVAVIGW